MRGQPSFKRQSQDYLIGSDEERPRRSALKDCRCGLSTVIEMKIKAGE